MTICEQSLSKPSDRPVYLKLAAVTMVWGGTFVAGRYLAGGLSPLLAASLRFLLASVALLLFIRMARTPLVRPSPPAMAAIAFAWLFRDLLLQPVLLFMACITSALHGRP